MNKQELIKKYKMAESVMDSVSRETFLKLLIEDLEQLDEPRKVKVPQCVADFIAEQKKLGHTLSYSIDASMSDRVAEWYWDNSELFALAWIFGYEVEEEKRYEVILCNGQSLKTVYRQGGDHLDFEMVYGDLESFTRKRLEEAGFGWVFDCPGIEIEEVDLCH